MIDIDIPQNILDFIQTFWLVVFTLAYLIGAIVFFCMVIVSGYEREKKIKQKTFQVGTFAKVILLFPWYALLFLLDILTDSTTEGIGILLTIGAIFFYMGSVLEFLGAHPYAYLYILLGSFFVSVPFMAWDLWMDSKKEEPNIDKVQ